MTDRLSGSGGGGGKGGGGGGQPTIFPDTLKSKAIARVIDVLSEGPIKGLVKGMQSIFMNDVPLQAENGQFNYASTKVHFRAGHPSQRPVPAFDAIEIERSVGEEVPAQANNVSSVIITNGGSGYTSAPSVTFVGGLGYAGGGKDERTIPTQAATGYATISGGKVTGVVITDPGGHYIAYPTVVFSGGGGSGAAGVVQMGGGVTRRITNPDVDAVRIKVRVPALFQQVPPNDDVRTAQTAFIIQYKGVNDIAWKSPAFDSRFERYTTQYSPTALALKCAIKLTVGKGKNWEVDFKVRKKGTSTWTTYDSFVGINRTKTTQVYYHTFTTVELTTWAEWEIAVTDQYSNTVEITDKFYLDDYGNITLEGKTSSGYEEAYKILLPPGGHPYDIRVWKTTGDKYTEKLTNDIVFSSYTELITSKMMYMDTAYIALEMDSEYYQGSVPKRSFLVDGRIIRVPSNYDADKKTYSGIWDGTFKLAYSNNPVWCFLDLLTHERYGLGQWVTDSFIDMGTLYQLAKYCDELVPDGFGDYEHRFELNTQVLNQEEAFNVLNILASAFRGMLYWSAGMITASQDAPGPVSRLVSPSNVIDGEFNYVGTGRKSRCSVVLVAWNDPDNRYERAIEAVEDPDLIDRYGYVTKEVTAYGCTSRGQAHRLGKWMLDSERFSTDVVTYKASWDHVDARPGEIVAVADPSYAGVRQGGRVVSASTQRVIMDAEYQFSVNESYTLTVNIPTWGTVNLTNGSRRITGNRTKFTAALKLIKPGDVIVFGRESKQYIVDEVEGPTSLLLTSSYQGKSHAGEEFTVVRSGSLLYSSYIPLIDVPVVPQYRENALLWSEDFTQSGWSNDGRSLIQKLSEDFPAINAFASKITARKYTGEVFRLDFLAQSYFGTPYACRRLQSGVGIAGAAYAEDSEGVWHEFLENEVRETDLGILQEAEATNYVRNNTMQGADYALGTPPTYWSVDSGNGITSAVTAVGSEDGLDYIDVNFWGTCTATTDFRIASETADAIAVAAGEAWVHSAFVKLVGGAIDNATFAVRLDDYNGATLAGTTAQAIALTTAKQRAHVTETVGAGVTHIRPSVSVWLAVGYTYDLTVRIYTPQVERGTVPSSVIKTSGTILTRAREMVYPSDLSVYRLQAGAGIAAVTYAEEADGSWTAFTESHLPRITSRGLLVERQSKNWIPNNTFTGFTTGSPGGASAGWDFTFTGATRTFNGLASVKGVEALDVSWQHAAATSTGHYLAPTGHMDVAAVAGDTWTGSLFYQDIVNDPNVTDIRLYLFAFDAAGTPLSSQYKSLYADRATWKRHSMTWQNLPAGTAYVQARLYFMHASGAAISQRFRFGGAQLEKQAKATSLIKTSGTALTRNADDVTSTAFANVCNASSQAFTVFVETDIPQIVGTVAPIGWAAATGYNDSAYVQYTDAGYAAVAASIVGGALQMYSGAGAAPATGVHRIAFSCAPNNGVIGYDGSVSSADSLMTLPSEIATFGLGSVPWVPGSHIDGYVRKVAFIPQRVSNNNVTVLSNGGDPNAGTEPIAAVAVPLYRSAVINGAGEEQVLSWFVRAGSVPYVALQVYRNSGEVLRVVYDLAAQESKFDLAHDGDGRLAGHGVEDYGQGWRRVWMKIKSLDGDVDVTATVALYLMQDYTSEIMWTRGLAGNETLFATGAMLEYSTAELGAYIKSGASMGRDYFPKTNVVIPTVALPEAPNPEAEWVLTGSDVQPRLFRIISNKEIEKNIFEIVASAHDETKFARIEKGLKLTPRTGFLDDRNSLPKPTNLQFMESLFRSNNAIRTRLVISWEAGKKAIIDGAGNTIYVDDPRVSFYRIEWNKDGVWSVLGTTTATSFELLDGEPGDYYFRVRPVTQIGMMGPAIEKFYKLLGKTAPPGDVLNLRVQRFTNGVQLSWDEVVDLDVVGYEIRDGVSWDSGKIIAARHQSTTIFIALRDIFDHTFHVKAIDELGIYSVNAATVTAAVVPPEDIKDFYVVADGDRLIFKWTPVPGDDIIYEIREGRGFGAGKLIGTFAGGGTQMMYPTSGLRTFWLKAKSSVGLYSLNPISATVIQQQVQDRNIVKTTDRVDLLWEGMHYNTDVIGVFGNELSIAAGKSYGEHVFVLPLADVSGVSAMRSRVWFDDDFIIDAGSPMWMQATFKWKDEEAQNPWRVLSDIGNNRVDWFIATDKPKQSLIDASYIEIFPLEFDVEGYLLATEPVQGRYVQASANAGMGCLVNDGREYLVWDGLGMGSTFNLVFDLRIPDASVFGPVGSPSADYVTLLRLLNVSGTAYLSLDYRRSGSYPVLLVYGSDNAIVEVRCDGDGDTRLKIGIVQTASERRLYVYNYDSKVVLEAKINAAPVGSLSRVFI